MHVDKVDAFAVNLIYNNTVYVMIFFIFYEKRMNP